MVPIDPPAVDAVSHLRGLFGARIDNPAFVATITSAAIGAIFTSVSLVLVMIQIWRATVQQRNDLKWKRSEYVRGLLSQLSSDPNIALTCRILDWRSGPAIVPPDFQELFRLERAGDDGYRVMEIDWERFVRALPTDRETNPEWRAADMMTYRACFDSFCSFIQQTCEDFRSYDVSPSQFADLGYFCSRVIHPRNARKDPDDHARAVMKAYVLEYNPGPTYEVIERYAESFERHSHRPPPDAERPSLRERLRRHWRGLLEWRRRRAPEPA